MKRTTLVCAITACTLSCSQISLSQQALEFQFAYRPAAFEALKKNIDRVTIISPEPFIVDASGVIYGEIEPRLLKLTKSHNVKLMPQVKNIDPTKGLFNNEWVHAILNDRKVGDRTMRMMVDLCKRYGLWGIQIDFENVHINDREALTAFYRAAAAALHEEGFKISIAVVHRAEESAGPNTYTQWMMKDWRAGYDLKALGEIGDFVKMMSYSQHTRRTTPGPSQGVPWLEQVIQYFIKYVPPEKLSLGITMGGAVFYTVADTALYYQDARSWSRGITLGEAESLIEQYGGPPLQWDDTQKMLYGYIDRGGVFEWFMIDNDMRSLDAKLALTKKYKIRAVNIWISGNENPGLWERIRDFTY